MILLEPETFGWDFLIVLGIAVSSAGAVGLFAWAVLYRKRKTCSSLSLLCSLLLALCSLVLIYGSFIEPRMLITNTYTAPFTVREPLKIVVISDIHVGAYKGEAWVQRVVDTANSLLPDIVLMPGDFILGDSSSLADLRPLQDLRTTMGSYAVLGNHDYGVSGWNEGSRQHKKDRSDDVAAALRETGVQVLRNSSARISWGDEEIFIAGIDDLWSGRADIEEALSGIPAHTPVILLSHNPSIILDEAVTGNNDIPEIVVSGHTHGGQIRLPFYGPALGVPTALGRQADEGMFIPRNGPSYFISRGVGESGPRARLLAPPEVSLLITDSAVGADF